MWHKHVLVATSPDGDQERFQFDAHHSEFEGIDPIVEFKQYLEIVGIHDYDDWSFEEDK